MAENEERREVKELKKSVGSAELTQSEPPQIEVPKEREASGED